MTSGTDPKTSGNWREISESRKTFHFDIPPMTGDLMEKMTRLIRVSRMAYEHIAQGSTVV